MNSDGGLANAAGASGDNSGFLDAGTGGVPSDGGAGTSGSTDAAGTVDGVKGQGGTAPNDARAVEVVDTSPVLVPKDVSAAGVGYRWFALPNSKSDLGRVAASLINDGDRSVDFGLADREDISNGWEAGGIVFPNKLSEVTRIEWTNGSWDAQDNGGFSANFGLQISPDGHTWLDAPEFTIAPSYPLDSPKVSGNTYAFTLSALSVKGVRVVGQINTPNALSYFVNGRELVVFAR